MFSNLIMQKKYPSSRLVVAGDGGRWRRRFLSSASPDGLRKAGRDVGSLRCVLVSPPKLDRPAQRRSAEVLSALSRMSCGERLLLWRICTLCITDVRLQQQLLSSQCVQVKVVCNQFLANERVMTNAHVSETCVSHTINSLLRSVFSAGWQIPSFFFFFF